MFHNLKKDFKLSLFSVPVKDFLIIILYNYNLPNTEYFYFFGNFILKIYSKHVDYYIQYNVNRKQKDM